MDTNYQSCNLEIWGGIECTINRIGESYRDQLHYAGHHTRENDIEEIAKLGISKLRYPLLWEAHEQEENQEIDWTRSTKQFEKIRDHGIVPIAGLIHHGSGPKFTSLTDPAFAEKFSRYTAKVARQFPWLEYYTPVNEPLTTARFSGLYGFWYPHIQNELQFIKMLLNELKATVLAMKEIRKVNSKAKLVQTEDLAKIHSTPTMKYQADFENERRWLSYDILCGKLDKEHFFWNYFLDLGIKESELEYFLQNACPPDIAGFNYYITSERYLDENVDRYPKVTHGQNENHVYADVAAVRATKPSGVKELLREAGERYQLPVALTEVHMHCTREEQLRWFLEIWENACELKKEGTDIRAITAWSLFGAYDWDSLLTREEKHYEAGVFDLTKHELRPTALAKLIKELVNHKKYYHPVVQEKGWWHRSYPGNNCLPSPSSPPLLIIGATGTLGNAFTRICEYRAIPYRTLTRQEVDITESEQIEKAIEKYKPWSIVNAAGYVRVDDAESEIEKCFRINTEGPANLATITRKHSIQLMTFSSDLVFDGDKQSPYIEQDNVKPLNIYGQSKADAEFLVKKNNPAALIIRTSAFFGPWDQYNFVFYILNSLKEKQYCRVVNDVVVSPTYIPDLVNKALDLLIDEETGLWHLTNEGKVSWLDFASQVADRAGYKVSNISSCVQEEMSWKAKRPTYSALESDKGIKLPLLEHAIERFFEEKII
jgi:dTDP-4-dehydrorhamnose reductase